MSRPAAQPALLPDPAPPEGVALVNDRVLVRTRDGIRVVIASGVALAHYAVGDALGEQHAMVHLVDQGLADQNDVARAFGCSTRSLRRYQRRFEEGGLGALGRGGGFPAGRRRGPSARYRHVARLKEQGLSNRQVALRMGLSEKAIRKALRRIGWKEPAEPEQVPLAFPGLAERSRSEAAGACPGADPNLSASAGPDPAATQSPGGLPLRPGADPNLSAFDGDDDSEPLPTSWDQDPADRRTDRLLACTGALDDAAPLFRSGTQVPGAGVLLAVPLLLQSGVLRAAREVYGSIGPAFYGLRTSMLAMLLMALLRIKRPEALKERSPQELGRVLGLDRAPEVKTLRRKLARLAALGRAAEFGRALARRRIALRGEAMGFLYVDGHVRVYHGKHSLPKAYVTRMRISLPATTDYWVNDSRGDPVFVVTAEANAGMVKMLPEVLAEARKLLGERRLTVAFDRAAGASRSSPNSSPTASTSSATARARLRASRSRSSPRAARSSTAERSPTCSRMGR